jgi:hypothetical protein
MRWPVTIGACSVMLSLCGCVSVTASKDSVKVSAFLMSIKQGQYGSGTTTLTVSDATPDQQSIAVLAGAVADLGKTAMLMAARTNMPATNSPAK